MIANRSLQPCNLFRQNYATNMNAANKIDYIEFQATDPAGTRKFFEQLFGWQFTDYGPDYTSFADGRIAGGFARSDKHSTSAGAACSSCFITRVWKKCVSE
jgi:predicted enzyme related to lactoylglutathione lyase